MTIGHQEAEFEWRHSQRSTINDLGLACQGYELVLLSRLIHFSTDDTSEQLVATCAASRRLVERVMVLRYLTTSFGYEWEVVSLMTLLVFWLGDRKHRRR
ncbi:hypothetical protein GGS20DRAFT_419365 [Poronia punctata]|nr:hypothetical protein GGS20DRAFT_419365 [Poronia punctata]